MIKLINILKESIDKISGGKSDNMSINDIGAKHGVSLKFIHQQYIDGTKVELEHTHDIKLASEIAKDHLYEDAGYYIKLKKMESK